MRRPSTTRAPFWRVWLKVSVEVFVRAVLAVGLMLALIWLLLNLLASDVPRMPTAGGTGVDVDGVCPCNCVGGRDA